MSPERWKQVDDLLQGALRLQPQDRRAFAQHACQGDQDLEREVSSLLASHEAAGCFLETGALEQTEPALDVPEEKTELAGSTVSHYRIIEKLGGGGMGVVYKAEDTRLRRPVALKFLPEELKQDPAALARFRREAQAASSLNHPNICIVHDIGEQANRTFIVMEYLDGRTLKHEISGQPVQLGLLIALATQICDGLEAAHANGIVHRDVKPANIFVCANNHVKILDFGIAKIQNTEAFEPRDETPAETVSDPHHLTATGSAIGTLDYMSPEQVRGEPLDSRSDLFSLGALLYEMAAGIPPFRGETRAAIYDAILHKNPKPVREINRALPNELEQIVSKCLQKDRHARYQQVAEIQVDLDRLRRRTDWLRRLRRARAGLGLAAASVCLAMTAYLVLRPPPAPHVSGYVQLTDDGQGKGAQEGAMVTDGARLYFGEGSGMWTAIAQVSASGGETLALPGAPLGNPESKISPQTTLSC